jgi:hypothetical protein
MEPYIKYLLYLPLALIDLHLMFPLALYRLKRMFFLE